MSFNCSKCQKITAGKFYSLFAGKKGGKALIGYIIKDENFFCSTCADQEKQNPTGYWTSEDLIKVEWDIENQTDREIIEFEKKWNNHHYDNLCLMPGGRIGETSYTLNFVQKVKKKFEPYLQKPEVVEKSFGGKIKGYGVIELHVDYLFAKSARNEKYRKEVVGPVLTEILRGGDPNQKINTISSSVTSPSDAQGSTRGVWKVNKKTSIPYCWSDNEGGDCRTVSFTFRDHKRALQALYQSLVIKEKELKGNVLPSTTMDSPDKKIKSEPAPKMPYNKLSEDKKNSPSNENQINKNWFLIISLSIIGITLLGGLIFFFIKRKNK